MKWTLAAVMVLTLGTLATRAATPTPRRLHEDNGAQICAADTDAENLCQWDSPRGTHGRKCTLDVERIDRRAVCNYGAATSAAMTDHKPMCISIGHAEHIVFHSGRGRAFRVRRLVPITATNADGAPCPRHPFRRAFHEEDMDFGGSFDSQAPRTEANGCQYKLEVQWNVVDPDAPVSVHDPRHRRLECRDPHLRFSLP